MPVPSRADTPARVPLGGIAPDARLLDSETKLITHTCRIAAYNTESGLARLRAPHYARAADEARSPIREALGVAGDIHIANGGLHVTLNALSAPPTHPRPDSDLRTTQRRRSRLPRHRPHAARHRQTPPRHHMDKPMAPEVLICNSTNQIAGLDDDCNLIRSVVLAVRLFPSRSARTRSRAVEVRSPTSASRYRQETEAAA